MFWAAWVDREWEAFEASKRELLDFYTKGAIKPFISERFPLDRAHEAISCLAARKAMGKIVVTVN